MKIHIDTFFKSSDLFLQPIHYCNIQTWMSEERRYNYELSLICNIVTVPIQKTLIASDSLLCKFLFLEFRACCRIAVFIAIRTSWLTRTACLRHVVLFAERHRTRPFAERLSVLLFTSTTIIRQYGFCFLYHIVLPPSKYSDHTNCSSV